MAAQESRRRHARARPPRDFPVLCTIPLGAGAPLEAEIMDIGEGGIGLLLHAASAVPAPGTRVAGCRIESSDQGVVLIDLEVRHAGAVELADGRRAQRWGCRFVDPSQKAKALIARFAAD